MIIIIIISSIIMIIIYIIPPKTNVDNDILSCLYQYHEVIVDIINIINMIQGQI